ncbi:MAG: chromate transporter [Lachnospiraceae bacterium]|nr:chromate transporter [Lachnospiraceae bacterium]
MTYLLLFLEFFKTGLFAIGGGMATIPFLYEIAGRYDWYTTSELVNMIAISESTPGPVGVNMATFAGYLAANVPGSILSTFALVLPSYLIILIIARMLDKFQKNPYVKNAFEGLRPTVVGLLAVASFAIVKVTFLTGTVKKTEDLLNFIDFKAVILFIILFAAVMKLKKHPIIYIGLGALAGILINL